MTKIIPVIRTIFAVCMIPCIYADVLLGGVSPRKQKRLLNKARRKLSQDPLLSHGLPVTDFAPIPTDLLNPGVIDPLLSPLSPLDTLLNEHQGLPPLGMAARPPGMDPVTRDIINRNKAIGTKEALKQNRQIKKGLRRARKQFRQEKRARKQIRKQERLLRKGSKPANGLGLPRDVIGASHDIIGLPRDVIGVSHDIGVPHDVIGLPAPISPLHPGHHIAEKLLVNDALDINKKIAKQDRKARRQIKKQQKLMKKAAKQANLIAGGLDVVPVPEPLVPLHPDHLADKILINDALHNNQHLTESIMINDALNKKHIAEKILVNDALNKGQLLGVGGVHNAHNSPQHDTHLHNGGGAIVKIVDAHHPPPHHPPPAQQKQNGLQSLVKGVILGGIGAMLLGK
ncbi:uncharacterized protein LOC132563234 [Ylistrum balloti]|uniref:uncharacterized protein LOC132563234 n=1 Tax=Ylistrum balloti TaxID=509963 RepID=UPI0029059453|nr:uncharacterized protein LOC132563234 [Ylistrum balloti]